MHAAVLSGTAIAALLAAQAGAQSASGPDGTLYGTRFRDLANPAILQTEGLTEPLIARIKLFQQRILTFRSALPAPPSKAGPERAIGEKRRRLEAGIVALIAVPAIETAASEYAAKATLYYEWEGMSEAPLAEAAYAEDYLRKNPQSPLKPFLHLFLAHRYRSAFEALAPNKMATEGRPVFRSYQGFVSAALKDPDPLVRFLAEDIGRQPFLYLKPGLQTPADADRQGPGRPALAIQEAADLAEEYIKQRKVDLSEQYLCSLTLRHDGRTDDCKQYWHVQWMWRKPRLGGEYGLRVCMDGHIVEARLGP